MHSDTLKINIMLPPAKEIYQVAHQRSGLAHPDAAQNIGKVYEP
jgi:cysteine sulfinate desulfinase/cysteine desulfurase-like protein